MKRDKNTVPRLGIEALEQRQVLTTLTTLGELAAIGVDPEAIVLISNVNGDFQGDVGVNNPSSPDVPFTDFVLNEPTLRNTVDAIAASEDVPPDAIELTAVSQFVGGTSQLSSGTVSSPNRYALRGDFTLANNQSIVVPSNVEIYVDGSIFKQGSFTSPAANTGGNQTDSIFDINGTDNIRLIGVNNALLHSNPSFLPTDPHTSGVIITGFADNITFEGFETRFFWNAVSAQFNTTRVTVRDNMIKDSINRSIWFLGTSDSSVHHNFISNAGLDNIDIDAFAADTVSYENVLIGSERFTYFVEEGANNNFSVRQLSIIHRFDESSRPGSFQLGNASNGTSPEFATADRAGEFTRDNFFLDNVTYAPTSQGFRGEFIATGDNGIVGNTYFYGNRSFSAGFGQERPPFGRDNTVRAIYGDRLPGEEILAARDLRFDSVRGFRSYDLLEELVALDARFNEVPVPVRSEILPLPVIPQTVYQESAGLVAIEAEKYSRQEFGTGSADGQFFGLLVDDDLGGLETSPGDSAVGSQGVSFDRNIGTNTGNALNGPRLDYDIVFDTPGTYNVHLRMRATIANTVGSNPTTNNSVHVGLNGVAVSNSTGFGVSTSSPTWTYTNDVENGPQDITITVTEAGVHTLNIWGREDGTELDRIVLTTSATAPTGFGPAESATLVASPLVGDYDLDFDVDDDDRAVWAANFGSSVSPWADGNNDGLVNAADYSLWRDNLGSTAAIVSNASAPQHAFARVSLTATVASATDESIARAAGSRYAPTVTDTSLKALGDRPTRPDTGSQSLLAFRSQPRVALGRTARDVDLLLLIDSAISDREAKPHYDAEDAYDGETHTTPEDTDTALASF